MAGMAPVLTARTELSHAGAPGPAGPGTQKKARRGRAFPCRRAVVPYCSRSQTCDLQMKATQPETSSFAPPSISCILDL